MNDVTKATGYYRVTPTAPAARAGREAGQGQGGSARAGSAGGGLWRARPAGHGGQAPRQPAGGGGPGGGGPAAAPRCSSRRTPTARFILTASRFEEFPNLWTAGPNFENLTKVSDANPQQSQYVWGRSELIEYINADGKKLRAILTKPDNFDPAKKYPLMVYIYEELTNGLHRYATPSPGTSINLARYVSNGYILLQPDIVYTTGYPGEDAFKCVIPAVQHVRRDGLRRPGARGHPGAQLGRVSDHVSHHAHRHVPRRRRPARRCRTW